MKALKKIFICLFLALTVTATASACIPNPGAKQETTSTASTSGEATSEEHEETPEERAARVRKNMLSPENIKWIIIIIIVSFVFSVFEQRIRNNKRRF